MRECPPAILVIEDNVNDERDILSTLGRAPLPSRLWSTRRREEAIAYLAGDEPYRDRERFPIPSVVVIDLELAEKSGLDILEWMKRHAEVASIPIVAISSSHAANDLNRAYAFGIAAYVDKADGFDELPAIVWGILGGKESSG